MNTVTLPRRRSGANIFTRARTAYRTWRERRIYLKSIALVPENLRYDVGLDGGARLWEEDQPRGRSFDHMTGIFHHNNTY